jgi:hypothetical protein
LYPDPTAVRIQAQMIVSSCYQGDDNEELRHAQFEVYNSALGILVSRSNRFARTAKRLLETDLPENWGTVSLFDHRTLQMAHDLLAAAWRFAQSRQFELRLDRNSLATDHQCHWLEWLRGQVDEWIDSPYLHRHIQQVLANQSSTIGFEAQTNLCRAILTRFPEVPWADHLSQAFEADMNARPGPSPTAQPAPTAFDSVAAAADAIKRQARAIEAARKRVANDDAFEVHEVLDSNDPEVDRLPILWMETEGSPIELPPKDCWYVLCDATPPEERGIACGGNVRLICVSKATYEIVYDDIYGEE